MALASGTGLVSGLPVDQIIGQLLSLRQRPIQQLQSRIGTFQNRQAAYVQVNNALLNLTRTAKDISETAAFQSKSAASSNTSALSVTTTSGASLGTHQVEVLQLASAHRIGAQGFADQTSTGVAAASGSFSFKVGVGGAVTQIAVDTTTTLAGLRDAINAAGAGVSASIVNDGSIANPHRLVLTSSAPGAANEIVITQNDTALNFATSTVEAAAAKTGNTYQGTATSSGTYTGSVSKRFVAEITAGGATGAAKFRVSSDGGVTWSAADAFTTSGSPVAIGDGVSIDFSAGTFAAGDRFEIDVFAPQISAAQDAVVRIDGVTLTRATNTVADAVEGVTLNLLQTTTTPAAVTISQDTATIRGKIVSFVSQYNEVIKQVAAATAFDPETNVRGALLGDSTVRSIRGTLANIALSTIPGLPSSEINSLGGIGITVNNEGQLVIDNAKLDEALNKNIASVTKLFATAGTTASTSLKFISATAATRPGTYGVTITQAAEQAQILSAQDLTGPLASEETLTFTVDGSTHTVTVAAGSTLSSAVDSINSQLSGLGLAIQAEAAGSKLRLFTTAFGSSATITVKSDQDGSSGTQLGIGTADVTDTGQNVAGTIGGKAATGSGQTLTGSAGSDVEGLAILVTATAAGFVGELTVSTGVGIQLSSTLESLTKAETGLIPSRQDGLSKSIESLNDQIERMNERIVIEEQRLRTQFAQLETLLSQFSQTSQFLAQQLASLSLNRS